MTIKNLESNKFGNVRALCGHSEEVIAELKDKYDARQRMLRLCVLLNTKAFHLRECLDRFEELLELLSKLLTHNEKSRFIVKKLEKLNK